MKIRSTRAALLLGVAVALATPLALGEDTKNTFCWKLTKGSGEVYLLGSIHLVPDDFYPMPKEIEDAYKASTALVVEADVEALQSDPQAGMEIMKKVMYGEGDSLSKHISAETKKELEEFCEKNEVPLAQLETMKVGFVAAQLQSVGLKDIGWTKPGADVHFLKKAKKKDKKIVELESVGEQIDIFTGFSDADAEKFLKSTMKETSKMKEVLEKLLVAWRAGDPGAVDKVTLDGLKESPESKAVMDKLIYDRNDKMAAKIDGYFKEKGPYFVCVGAAHLVGERGLIKQLEKKGATVKQLTTVAKAKAAESDDKDSEKKETKDKPKDEGGK